MKNETTAKGVLVMLVFLMGLVSGSWFAPEERIVEKNVEVKIVEQLPAMNQDIYSYCVSQARGALYSNWNGEPNEGTTPKNTQDFIDDCFSKLTQ